MRRSFLPTSQDGRLDAAHKRGFWRIESLASQVLFSYHIHPVPAKIISHIFGRHPMKRFAVLLVILAVVGVASTVFAQTSTTSEEKSLEQTLQDLSADAARAYVSPIVSGFGANLNSGWFHRAPRSTMFGLDLDFGIVGMGTFFKDEHKKFSASGSFRFNSSQAMQLAQGATSNTTAQTAIRDEILKQSFNVSFSGPTITGAKNDSLKVIFAQRNIVVNSQTYTLPGQTFVTPVVGFLEDAKAIPLVAPQLTIGTFLGSQFTFRYVPDIDLEDFGKIKYFGFGVQHNPGVWFGDILPLELSASFFTQALEAGSVFKTKATAFGVNASKRLGWGFLNITPYAGFMVESSSMEFTYDYVFETNVGTQKQQVKFELTGENKTRITAGVSVKVLIVNINADYNWSKYNSASVGVMFII